MSAIKGKVTRDQAAVEFLVAQGIEIPASSGWKLDCAYGACKRTFDPNGTGPLYHGGCSVGSVMFGMLAKAKKAGDAEFQAKLAIAQKFADKLAAERKAAAEAAK